MGKISHGMNVSGVTYVTITYSTNRIVLVDHVIFGIFRKPRIRMSGDFC